MKEYRVFDKVTNSYSKEECWSITPSGKLYYGNAEWENGVVEFATGLKDKNGVMIYEGDIVTLTYKESKKVYTRTVIYEECMFILSLHGGSGGSLGSYNTQVNRPDIEVISNIHDTLQGDNA